MTTLRFTVTDADTATALGSGDVPVLATPRLLAWLEAATVAAAAPWVDSSSTTVGIEAFIRHRRASAVGTTVEVQVTAVAELDRGLAFDVLAHEVPAAPVGTGPAAAPAAPATVTGAGVAAPGPAGREIASGRVVRAVVDRAAFLARL
jgi:predicted thioesterase